MRLAYLSPLAPIKSGIASYSAMLLPALASRADVAVVVDQPSWDAPANVPVLQFPQYSERRGEFDAAIYHLGNNPHHEFIYLEAIEHPGVVVLHDLVLHHLIVEMTLARGDAEGYVEALKANHGDAGAAWAQGRVLGYHHELANFLYPASKLVADRSLAVIVHNQYAADRLAAMGVGAFVHKVEHPFVPPHLDPDSRGQIRNRHGYGPSDRVIGMFGFVTSAKRPEVVVRAFAEAARMDPDLRLMIVGEPAPNVDLVAMARDASLPAGTWKATGYVDDAAFDAYLSAVDGVVSLRYPSAGETSGALLRVFYAGKPVAVSDYAQFSEYPADMATRIPLGEGELEALTQFLLDPPPQNRNGREWLARRANADAAADGYMSAIRGDSPRPDRAEMKRNPIPVFPSFRFIEMKRDQTDRRTVALWFENGDVPLRAVLFGNPEYRLLVKFFKGEMEIDSDWLRPGKNVEAGTLVEFRVEVPDGTDRLDFHHALEGIPFVPLSPFASVSLAS